MYILKLIRKFGILEGSIIFFKLYVLKSEKIRISSIKYPLYLRLNNSDLNVFFQIFLFDEYKILENESHPKYILDCGANIGLFSVLMANRYPDAIIIAVEPDANNFSQLIKNTTNYKNIKPIKKAIWKNSSKLSISDDYNLGSWGLIIKEDEINGKIEATKISDLMLTYEIKVIDILKIDIETSEKYIFDCENNDWIITSKLICVEIHDRMLSGCGEAFLEQLTIN